MSFVSVCCVVKNIPKRVYVLPRRYKRSRSGAGSSDTSPESVTNEMVIQELAGIMGKLKITKYTTKVVKKMFAFDKKFANKDDQGDIPTESEYIQVEYHTDGGSGRNLTADLSGETFLCVFGVNSSYTEHLLIDLKIKGLIKKQKTLLQFDKFTI